jgi:electron transfer flavoprotein beta subunit
MCRGRALSGPLPLKTNMNIAVCLKRIPAPDGNIRLSADGRHFDFSLVDWVLNPPDEHALEAALRLRERNPSSRLLALGLGPRENETILRMALAVGADDARLVEMPTSNASLAARLAAGALRDFAPDLVLCGHQAVDNRQGLFPAALAEALGFAHVTGIYSIELNDDTRQANCRRRVEGGEQVIQIELPAVIACDRMAHELRTPLLKARLASKKRPLTILQPETLSVDALQPEFAISPRTLRVPPERIPKKVLTAGPGWSASEFLMELKDVEGLDL